MTAKSGSYDVGPNTGTLTINTYVGGMGAKMGHDLVFEARTWRGTVVVDAEQPAGSSVEITVDVDSLEIVKAVGGIKPLTDKDRADIAQNRAKTLQSDRFHEISFSSTAVTAAGSTLAVVGDMTIMGTTRPVTMDVELQDSDAGAHLTGTATIVQTEFGVRPYSKLGALKVKDAVDLTVSLDLVG